MAGLLEVKGFPVAPSEVAPNGVIQFAVQAGELVLLQGPNGSGKTTLLRAIAGLPAERKPESITWNGNTVVSGATLAGIHLALQDPRDNLVGLTVEGEFRLRGAQLPAHLQALRDRDVATLSSGETRQVSLAVAEGQERPSLLMLDEPCEGLGPHGRAALVALVQRGLARGAVLAVDHSGLLAAMATRRIALGSEPQAALDPLPRRPGAPMLVAGPASVRRGESLVMVPGVALPAGFHCLVGENGAGKSTLLLRLAGLVGGDGVHVDGKPRSAGQIRLLLPRARDLFTKATVQAELAGTRQETGLVPATLHSRHPLTLSGGEAQRAALAKTFGASARVYLLDEPEAYLDGPGWLAMWAAVRARVGAGACILAATHDARLHALAHSFVVMPA